MAYNFGAYKTRKSLAVQGFFVLVIAKGLCCREIGGMHGISWHTVTAFWHTNPHTWRTKLFTIEYLYSILRIPRKG